jgi:C-methyltransferase C-terminal domain
LESWRDFAQTVESRRDSLRSLVLEIVDARKTIYGLGASTKGNVLLNYSQLDNSLISLIGEVNPYKFGRVTPGSHIPIVPEQDILKLQPDYLLFLPWHFRENAIQKYSSYLTDGGRFIFPLPSVEVLGY